MYTFSTIVLWSIVRSTSGSIKITIGIRILIKWQGFALSLWAKKLILTIQYCILVWSDFFVVDLKEDGTALTKGQAWFCEFPKNYTLVEASPLSVVFFLCIWIYLLYTLFRVILNCIELVWINQILRWIKNIMCWMLDSIHRTRIKTEKMQMS